MLKQSQDIVLAMQVWMVISSKVWNISFQHLKHLKKSLTMWTWFIKFPINVKKHNTWVKNVFVKCCYFYRHWPLYESIWTITWWLIIICWIDFKYLCLHWRRIKAHTVLSSLSDDKSITARFSGYDQVQFNKKPTDMWAALPGDSLYCAFSTVSKSVNRVVMA